MTSSILIKVFKYNITLGCILLCSFSNGFSQETRNYLALPVHIDRSIDPQVVEGQDGNFYLSYHLLVSNQAHVDLTLNSLLITGEDNSKIIFYSDEDLDNIYKFRSTLINGKKRSRTISSGDTGMLFFWVGFDDTARIPPKLLHQFNFEYAPGITIWNKPLPVDEDIIMKGYSVPVSKEKPRVFLPPLKGDNWRVGNGPGDYTTSHQFVLTSAGETRIPQRYAIDFQIVDDKGIILPTPLPASLTNEMFYGYKEKVYAVADGVISAVKDSIPENTPKANGAIITGYDMDATTVSGNYVTLKIGDAQYVHYAHLVPGSIKVKTGDLIKAGDEIGLLGNSGNSTGPHLHFNFTDGRSANDSHGLPYVFSSFFDNEGRQHENQMPLNGRIIHLLSH